MAKTLPQLLNSEKPEVVIRAKEISEQQLKQLQQLDEKVDQEDVLRAEKVLKRIKSGKEKTHSLDSIEKFI